ncbi:MAG: UDP-glucose 4-epimerase GalE [Ignavibacteriae bacterium]|nr:UDP-glucose 4-epimerase GalE [Ignavibacteriota bacterium]NOG97342.1 UDP-glucose 4-epimerase GalE [Ignavibacteriota bacterium]
MKTLITGGAGYIGSHCVKKFLEQGHEVVVLDNLSRGHQEAVPQNVELEVINLLDADKLKPLLEKHKIEAIVHFAAFAYVGESVESPAEYYQNNVVGSFNLIKAAAEIGIKKFVFSSTCSLYGNPDSIPISEEESIKPINPYAKTKMMVENILADFNRAYGLNYVALRYFNAAGADPSGSIGESHEPETHLIPLVIQTALGEREKILVFGDDYKTEDGTCIRDYIHVNDLSDAHLKALEYLNDGNESTAINLGTGSGFSVLEIIKEVEKIADAPVKFEIVDRREGDPAVLVADNKKAKKLLGWSPQNKLSDIILHALNWHKNPKY